MKYSKEYRSKYYKEWCKRQPVVNKLFNNSKRRSKLKGLKHNLDIIDIYIPKKCPVIGLRLKSNIGVIADNSYTLDRINNNKGYVKGNVRVISNLANKMKNNATKKQLVRFAKWVLTEYA